MVSTVDSGHDHRKLGSLHKAHQLESTQTVLLDQAQFPGAPGAMMPVEWRVPAGEQTGTVKQWPAPWLTEASKALFWPAAQVTAQA